MLIMADGGSSDGGLCHEHNLVFVDSEIPVGEALRRSSGDADLVGLGCGNVPASGDS